MYAAAATNIEHMPNTITRPLRNVARSLNKHVLNPAMLRMAGRKYWYAAAISHTGRRSGKTYTTPIVADRIAHGFIIPLPYGTSVDWLRNVLASGQATITAGGQSYQVTTPEIVDAASALPQMPPLRRRILHGLNVENYLKVEVVT